MTSLRAAVVVASNRAAAGVYDDTTGPLLVDLLVSLGFSCAEPIVVPDGEPVGAAILAEDRGLRFVTDLELEARATGKGERVEIGCGDAAVFTPWKRHEERDSRPLRNAVLTARWVAPSPQQRHQPALQRRREA